MKQYFSQYQKNSHNKKRILATRKQILKAKEKFSEYEKNSHNSKSIVAM